MRKHNLTKEDLEKQKEASKAQKDANPTDPVQGPDSVQTEASDQVDESPQPVKLGTNSWRFEQLETIEKDPEVLEQQRQKKLQDEAYQQAQSDKVTAYLRQQPQVSEDNSNVRTLTEQEKASFLELQRQIEHKKMVDRARAKKPTKQVSIDHIDDDNYMELVGKRLDYNVAKEGNLDDDLCELLGDLNVQTTNDAPKPFDLDQLLTQSRESQSNPEEPTSRRVRETVEDDFLNQLLH